MATLDVPTRRNASGIDAPSTGAAKAGRPVLLAALAFAFRHSDPVDDGDVVPGRREDVRARTEWIPAVWHLENYPNALVARAVRAIFPQQRHRLDGRHGRQSWCSARWPAMAWRNSVSAAIGLVLLLILSTLMLPLEVTLVPTFLVVHKFEWMNTYQGIVAPLLIDAFGVFLMRQSIISIPSDYIEAARIDGAGELRILLQIIVPQCMPALSVLAIFSFRDSWDQFLWPLTVVSID